LILLFCNDAKSEGVFLARLECAGHDGVALVVLIQLDLRRYRVVLIVGDADRLLTEATLGRFLALVGEHLAAQTDVFVVSVGVSGDQNHKQLASLLDH